MTEPITDSSFRPEAQSAATEKPASPTTTTQESSFRPEAQSAVAEKPASPTTNDRVPHLREAKVGEQSIQPRQAIQPRAAILQMPEYHPPLANRASSLRLDFNENTFAPSPRVVEALRNIQPADLTIYPEREPYEAKTAAALNLAPSQLLLTNAVDEAIHIVTFTFLNPGDDAIICTPSFFMYDVNIMSMGANLIRIQADDTLAFPYDRFTAAITPNTRLIILASPNNPTGTTVSRQQIHTIAALAPQAVILIDEAYYHFHGETVINDFDTLPNVLVARTFSKAYGLANLRLGLLAGLADLIAHCRKAASPYNVNGLALRALDAALDDPAYIDWYVGQIKSGRTRLEATFTELNIPFWPSEANFVLTRIGPKHKALVTAMRNRGILLRNRSSDPGLDGCVRFTIGTEDQITQCIDALRASITEIAWTPAETTAPDLSPKEPREYE